MNKRKKIIAVIVIALITGGIYWLSMLNDFNSAQNDTKPQMQLTDRNEIEMLTLNKINLFINSFKLILLIGSPLLIVALVVIFSYQLFKKYKKSDEKQKPFIFQVPKNHSWIVRLAHFTDPGDPLAKEDEKIVAKEPRGYHEWREGYGGWLPVITVDEGIVSRQPKERNVKAMEVMSNDGNPILIDFQATTSVNKPKFFVINMPGNNMSEKEERRAKIEDSLFQAALNEAANEFRSDELAALKKGDTDINLGDKVKNFFINHPELSLLRYGIRLDQLGIQKVYTPNQIQDAISRKRAAAIEKDAAVDEAMAIKTVIDKTGANATVVMIAQTIADVFRGRKAKERG